MIKIEVRVNPSQSYHRDYHISCFIDVFYNYSDAEEDAIIKFAIFSSIGTLAGIFIFVLLYFFFLSTYSSISVGENYM